MSSTQMTAPTDVRTNVRALIALAIVLQAIAFLSIAPIWLFGCLVMYVVFMYVPQLSDSRLLRFALIAISVALFFIDYRIAYSVEMASVFLLLVASMKATELKTKRDVLVFVYSLFYLTAVSMLFEQSISHVFLQLISVLLCFSLLMRLHDSSLGSVRSHIWRVGKLLAFAVPLAICLFLFFPRLAPLWSLPIKTSHSQTGMSEVMSPGNIAELSQSAERAFRVTFQGEAPPRQELYWRAMPLDEFDGQTWRRSRSALMMERAHKGLLVPKPYEQYQPRETSDPHYNVILEPHNKRWAFALAGSQPLSSNVHLLGGGTYEFVKDVSAPTPYRMSLEAVQAFDQQIVGGRILLGVDRVASRKDTDLQLPLGGNPLIRQWVAQQLLSGPTEAEFIQRVLNHYRQNEFSYTLRPPPLGVDSVDDFFFATRAGFCGHYASSLTFILREAGIPARVVQGYQGGEFNEDLGYWIIRQYDAHAWVEAFIENVGWVRVDPTAYIAPDRIERNLEEAMRDEGSFLADNKLALFARSIKALNWIMLQADRLNFHWQQFVLGYGEQQQRALLKRFFGDFSYQTLLWAMVGVFSVLSVVLIVTIWLGRYSRNLSRAERKYLRFLLFLRAFGVARRTGETPNAFLSRVSGDLNPLLRRLLESRTESLIKSLYQV